MNRPWLYRGRVGHARVGSIAHAFSYEALFIHFPLSQRHALRSWLFGVNRWNLFGFSERDHGDGGDPEAWMRDILARHGLDRADGEIWLQTLPRILGFVFNPVSFWYCHDSNGDLRAVFCEVSNTFGERHGYLLSAPGQAVIDATSELVSQKVFHVSPFFPVDGEYHFRFVREARLQRVHIDYHREGALALKTYVSGKAQPMTDANLLRTFLALGWATAGVVLRIHWQALKLWRKGATFHRKPEPPSLEITP